MVIPTDAWALADAVTTAIDFYDARKRREAENESAAAKKSKTDSNRDRPVVVAVVVLVVVVVRKCRSFVTSSLSLGFVNI